jgi:hypothetical protein
LEIFLRNKSKMPNELKSLRHGCRWFQPLGFILGSVAVLQQEYLATVRYRTQLGAARPLPRPLTVAHGRFVLTDQGRARCHSLPKAPDMNATDLREFAAILKRQRRDGKLT